MRVGIYGISSQSGLAFLADFLNRGYEVNGYARPTAHGKEIIDAIKFENGVYLERPSNSNHEGSKFVSLANSFVTNDLKEFISNVDIIIIAVPSSSHLAIAHELVDAGICECKIPLILSPSRTFATPYMWMVLGEGYPIACFSTCPYSCKRPANNIALIKRRKRTWMVSLEGTFTYLHRSYIDELFPQAAISTVPALTSLNNIGAVFHCATYMLNLSEIAKCQESGTIFSFYMDGIANRPEVGKYLESIDQVRLHIANRLGIETFGLDTNPREDIWRKLTNGLRALEEEHENDVDILRVIRRQFMEYINNTVISAQHWLDMTYGVVRVAGENLSDTIARTPTYQKNSVPQLRYLSEDIPTGLVPLEALANYLDIDSSPITSIIDKYEKEFDSDVRTNGRNLKMFSRKYIEDYLLGKI